MSRHDDRVTLRQMLDHVREVTELTTGRSRSDLDTDRVLCLALLQLLQIVGKPANRLSEACRELLPEIPWAEIIALRNRLIHAYNNVDTDILWKVMTVDTPALIASLENIVRANGSQERTPQD